MYICKTNTGHRVVETVFKIFMIEQTTLACMILKTAIYRSVNRETLWMI